MERVTVNSLNDLLKTLDQEPNLVKMILFAASKNNEGTKSWCGDCNSADPVIESCLNKMNESPEKYNKGLFITVYVGNRDEYVNVEIVI